jgi:hypothetical protein
MTDPRPTPDVNPSKPGWKSGRFLAFAALGALIAPIVVAETGGVTRTTTSNLTCATARPVISQADITYLGAIRMPANGADTMFAGGGLTGRVVNGQTHLFVYGNGTQNPRNAIYEIADPGSGYSTDYHNAPRATLVTNWGDVYHGKQQTWDAQGNLADIGASLAVGGLYWNDATQLLYWTYYDSYNVGGRQDWGLGASALTDPSSGASTAYGPWRTTTQDADGRTHDGPWRCLYMFANPLDNSMMCGSTLMSGNVNSPWGPDAYGGRPWPTATTPGGNGAPDLNLPNRFLEYYFMGGNLDANGAVHGPLRSFRRTTELPLWEPFAGTITLRANPAVNGGVGSWSDADETRGALWLELTNKHGVIFTTNLVGAVSQNPGDCTNAAHEWYSNAGVNPPNGACTHGCAPPVQITGPVTTAAFPAFSIYDPDQLLAVRNGTIPDYSVDPRSVIDLEQTYHIKTANIYTVGSRKTVHGMYFDPVRKYLFVLAPAGDDGLGPQYLESLIHVFAIQD